MKKLFLSIAFFVSTVNLCFAQTLFFTYDEAGNQLERNYVCPGCAFPTDPTPVPAPVPIPVPEELRVYPNPTSGPISIDWIGDYQKKVMYVLVNSTDFTYHQQFAISETSPNKINIDLTSKPPGVYFVTFFLNSGTSTIFVRKIIKL
jgi:hypothetical protein